ncbi:MAG: hypothetical protein K8T20_18260, partial [Planctomycetes bacterium]|nr:hypothetical protein [Planctomycetota bacterium]
MRRLILAFLGLAAFTGILAAAFLGGGPVVPKTVSKAAAPQPSGPRTEEPPKRPEPLLGVEPVAPIEGERHGARMSAETLVAFDQALSDFAAAPETRRLAGRERAMALAAREAAELWGAKQSVASASQWIVAIDASAADAPPASAAQIAAALAEFQTVFEKRFAALIAATPPPADWVAPVVVLPSRDEYLRRTHPRMFATSHTHLPSGWAYLAWTGRDLRPALFHEATVQLWRALSRPRAPAGIPVSRLSAWFWLGTAEYLEGAPVPLKGSEAHDAGDDWRDETRKVVREGRFRLLRDFLAIRQADLDAESDPLRLFAFRAQAWAFVNFLETSGGGKRRELLDRFAELVLSGKGGPEAASECFGDLVAFNGEFV